MTTPALYLPIKTTIEIHLETAVIPKMLAVLAGAGMDMQKVQYNLNVHDDGKFAIEFEDVETNDCLAAISSTDIDDPDPRNTWGDDHLQIVLLKLCAQAWDLLKGFRAQQKRIEETKIRSYV